MLYVRKLLSSVISAGTVSVSSFLFKSRNWRLVRFPSSLGILPRRSLSSKSSKIRFDKAPTHVGIVPAILTDFSDSSSRLVNSCIQDGNSAASKGLADKNKYVSSVRDEIPKLLFIA